MTVTPPRNTSKFFHQSIEERLLYQRNTEKN
jgi:hypothetical protein